jgi:DNA-binding transcriptional MerR regulator
VIDDPLVTTAQAALLHGVAQATIRSWAARGLLTPERHVGKVPMYRLSDVDEAELKARQRDVSGRTTKRLM